MRSGCPLCAALAIAVETDGIVDFYDNEWREA